jgi:D-3-phosphoglycerate dehydrogenase / 2-oxoglutarate reductase
MPRVTVTDYTFPSLEIEQGLLEPLGLTVVGAQCRKPAELIELLRGTDFVLTQFAPLTAEVIASLSNAQVIVRYGIGVDNVDLAAARTMGIPVCNVPDFCIDEVADHTLALILAATRQVYANAERVRKGAWGLAVPLPAMRCLKSLTVGIIGFGRIGREVAARLRPFKCRILVHDPIAEDAVVASLGYVPASLDEVLGASDVVTLHCPATESTFHLINSQAVAKMKDQAIVINVARGAVVCTESLLEGLRSGKLGFAALDVLEVEPIPSGHPLLAFDNVLIHSHLASASQEAVTKLRRDAASLVALAAQGKPLQNVVNGVTPALASSRSEESTP